MAAGLDSLAVTETTHRIENLLSMDLPATVLFDHPTLDAIVTLSPHVALGKAINKDTAITRKGIVVTTSFFRLPGSTCSYTELRLL